MKKCEVNTRKIYFLDFTFNPVLRTLHQDDTVFQLRKKQSDVLALLCAKYPEPVSQAEFLAEVWGGGYVTSQSIAQTIRSLRINLGDDTKSIIVTIPKLGYQLTAQPRLEEPEREPDIGSVEPPFAGNNEVDNDSFSTQSMINMSPTGTGSLSVIPSAASREMPEKKKLSPQAFFLSAIVVLFFSQIFVAMTAENNPLDLIKSAAIFDQMPSKNLVPRVGNDLLSCCNATDEINCQPQENLFSAQCTILQDVL